jgi:catechol 2,3-dioxygenase-like lactoylglutathione lyase family enzyme
VTIVGIDHVQLAMPAGQEQAARKFYAELLGLPELPKPATLAARGGAWFENGQVKLHLGVEQDFRPARKAHPGLLVDDLPALVHRLRSAGVTVTPDDSLPGQARCFVHDPFGNRLELLAASPAPAPLDQTE